MFFQGSEKYPTQKDLESAIYECGGSFNAYTSKSSTVFYIDASKKCLEKPGPDKNVSIQPIFPQ